MNNKIKQMIVGYTKAIKVTEEEEIKGCKFSPELKSKIETDCAKFYDSIIIQGIKNTENFSWENVGIDFWLTRNGHGAGFWDSPEIWGEENSNVLTDISTSFGETWVYVGDDGLVYA